MTKPLHLERKWKHYGLRTSNSDGTSFGGFRWPETGMVECPDWSPAAKCGNGLHALLNGEGSASHLAWDEHARWQLVGFDEYVDLQGKVKFAECEVASGTREQVTSAIKALTGAAVHGCTATAGDGGTATAGYRGTATAGYRGTATAGDGGTATAGYRGTATAGDGGTATAGDSGTATAGDGGTATAGYRGTATAGHRGTATAGDRGTATAGHSGTATAGDSGTATAGDGGTLIIKWWDGSRYRLAVGYVGEGGIKPNTPYRCEDGKFVEVRP
jgi:hypothetical protein